MNMLRDWKIHLLCISIVIICELIGSYKIWVIMLFPMLYAMLFGGIISVPKFKILNEINMKNASGIMTVTLLLLIAKLGMDIGPALPELKKASVALILQEIGHFFGTIMLGLPIAVALGMGREAIGATYSVGREPNIAIIADKYTLDSPEGRGVMAMYIMGTLFGAIAVSILASLIGSLDILHPYALAMGAGVGSGSMMAAAVGPIIEMYPDYESSIRAYAATANLLSSIVGIYIYMFFSLPLAVRLYDVFSRLFGRNKNLNESK